MKTMTEKKDIQEQTNKEFISIVSHKFKMWCDKEGRAGTVEDVIEYLLCYNILLERTVNYYTILDNYPKALHQNDGSRTKAIYDLSDKYPLSERKIWDIIINMQKNFKKRK